MVKFDKSKLQEAAGKIAQKSSNVVESGKLKLNINNLEKEISGHKMELGQIFYDACKTGKNAEPELRQICEKVDRKYLEIMELQQEMENIK